MFMFKYKVNIFLLLGISSSKCHQTPYYILKIYIFVYIKFYSSVQIEKQHFSVAWNFTGVSSS